MAGNRTEKPTDKRRQDAREKGTFARARDAGGIAAAVGVFIALAATGASASSHLRDYAARSFAEPLDVARGDVAGAMARFGHALAALMFPSAGAALIAAVAIGVAEAGFHPNLGLAAPDWSRIGGLAKLKQILLPTQALFELALSVAKVGVVGWVVWAALRDAVPRLVRLATTDVWAATITVADVLSRVALSALVALAVLSLGDYLQSRTRINKSLMMSRQEVKEEHKQQEGDPRVKTRIRGKMRERLRRVLTKQVKTADVVVTNPTHVSVALRYRASEGAPVVVAKGYDDVALYIRTLAREHKVPIVESPPLARSLASRVRVGRHIPVDLYAAVAEVLAFVYRLRARGAGAWA